MAGREIIPLPEGMRIARMHEGHLERVAELERLCFSVPWTMDMLRDELKNPIARYFVAEETGRCVGYAGMQIVVGEGYITNVASDPAYRGMGIGKALLRTLIDCAVQWKLDFLSLEVRRSNIAAQNLYRSMGFSEVGVRRNYYHTPVEDALLMTRFMVRACL